MQDELKKYSPTEMILILLFNSVGLKLNGRIKKITRKIKNPIPPKTDAYSTIFPNRHKHNQNGAACWE